MIYISKYLLPGITLIIIIYGLYKKRPIYDDFMDGVKEGLKMIVNLFPTIMAMVVGVGIFTKSGIIVDIVKYIDIKVFPKEILPLVLLRPISGSSSLMLLNNLMEGYGVDSRIGLLSAVIAGSTDTTIYIIGMYFGSIKIKKIRYALVVGLLADLACVIISILLIK